MPFAIIIGTADNLNITTDEKDGKCISEGPFKGGLKGFMEMNEIKGDKTDCALYPYWGYPTRNGEVLVSRGSNMT